MRIHRRRLREKPGWVPALLYVALALILGTQGHAILDRLVPPATSPVSSASAIAMLSAIASGMMAVTGIVFSLALVGFQIGMSAYSPRLVTELSRGRLLSHTLGIFAGTFLYALAAIRSVDIHGAPGVNTAVIGVALLWLFASIGMLVRLVPMLRAFSIPNVLSSIGRRGGDAVRRVFPPYRGAGSSDATPHGAGVTPGSTMRRVVRHGEDAPVQYLLALDVYALVRAARAGAGRIHVPHAVGERVLPGEPLAIFTGGTGSVSEASLRNAIVLGSARSLEYDPAYALRLLVDIAIRALSPGINDPSSAVSALDQIELLLRRLGNAELGLGTVPDDDGTVRLRYGTPGWEEMLSLALTEIQHSGRDSVQVQRRMGALLHDLHESVPEPRREAVRRFDRDRRSRLDTAFASELERAAADQSDRQGLGHRLPTDLSRAG